MIIETYKIELSLSFNIDLILTLDYVKYRLCNEKAADDLRKAIFDKIISLSSFPNRYKQIEDNIRQTSVKRFNLYYSIDELTKTVTILHVLYQGADISKIATEF